MWQGSSGAWGVHDPQLRHSNGSCVERPTTWKASSTLCSRCWPIHAAALPGLLRSLAERDESRFDRSLWPLTELIRVEVGAPYPESDTYVYARMPSTANSG